METIARGAAIYLILLVIMRISGRRTLAEITPFDFILLLIIAETTQQALLGDDFSITTAALLIVTLLGIDIAFAAIKRWSPTAAKLLEGVPTVIIRDGKLDRHALDRARLDEDDIMVAARQAHGLERMDQIKHAVLESDSGISVVPKQR